MIGIFFFFIINEWSEKKKTSHHLRVSVWETYRSRRVSEPLLDLLKNPWSNLVLKTFTKLRLTYPELFPQFQDLKSYSGIARSRSWILPRYTYLFHSFNLYSGCTNCIVKSVKMNDWYKVNSVFETESRGIYRKLSLNFDQNLLIEETCKESFQSCQAHLYWKFERW